MHECVYSGCENMDVNLNKIIAGALFDFLGFLITGPEIKMGAGEHSSVALDALKKFAASRNLILADADVQNWYIEGLG